MFAPLDLPLVHELVIVVLTLCLILTSLFASLIVLIVILLLLLISASAFASLLVASCSIARLFVIAVALCLVVRIVFSGFLSDLHDGDLSLIIVVETSRCASAHGGRRGLRPQLIAIIAIFILILGSF